MIPERLFLCDTRPPCQSNHMRGKSPLKNGSSRKSPRRPAGKRVDLARIYLNLARIPHRTRLMLLLRLRKSQGILRKKRFSEAEQICYTISKTRPANRRAERPKTGATSAKRRNIPSQSSLKRAVAEVSIRRRILKVWLRLLALLYQAR